jgi:hypothetical protein
MPYAEFTLWLTPHKALAGRLRSLIRRLAEEFDAIPLEPHLTVFCGPSDEAEAARIAHQAAARFESVELLAQDLQYSDMYTKTLLCSL